jgi:putative hydrolase of the HAD superfamily
LGTSVKAVTFDLWQTLLFERDGAAQRRNEARCKNLSEALANVCLAVSAEQVRYAMKEASSYLVKIWDTNRDVSHNEQLRLLITTVLEKEQIDERLIASLSFAYASPIFDVPPYINPDAVEVLDWLQKREKRMAIICNTGLTPSFALRRLLEDENVGRYFDTMAFSDELGIRKPDPRIFEHVALQLHLPASNIVHVGDNYRSDALGAKGAGFRSIHLKGSDGVDREASSDRSSLYSLSRDIGVLQKEDLVPDRTVRSLRGLMNAIRKLEE